MRWRWPARSRSTARRSRSRRPTACSTCATGSTPPTPAPDATGVTASIVSISASEQVLILTADETGTDAQIGVADTAGSVLQDLGLIDGGGGFQNELQEARNAQLLVDGLATIIERQSNTVDDVFGGVTLSLFKAEAGTTIKLDVERDLNQVKSAIVDFVDAYNELRSFINQQALTDVPEDDETGAGILAGTSALSEVRSRLSAAVGAAVDAADPTLAVLAEIGITFQSPGQAGDPLLANTLEIDEAKLDDALLTKTDAVRALFSFQLTSSSPSVALVGLHRHHQLCRGRLHPQRRLCRWRDRVGQHRRRGRWQRRRQRRGLGQGSEGGRGRRRGPAAALHRQRRRERHPARSLGRHRRAALWRGRWPGRRDQRPARQRDRRPRGPERARPGAHRAPRAAPRARAGTPDGALRRDGDGAHHDEPAARQPAPADRIRRSIATSRHLPLDGGGHPLHLG